MKIIKSWYIYSCLFILLSCNKETKKVEKEQKKQNIIQVKKLRQPLLKNKKNVEAHISI